MTYFNLVGIGFFWWVLGMRQYFLVMFQYFWLCASIFGYVQVFLAMRQYFWLCASINGYTPVFLVLRN
jgi:hypothetical protein